MWSLGHAFMLEKFSTLMSIWKPMHVKNCNKTVSKIIDVANVVDANYQMYWDKKMDALGIYEKQVGARLRNLKKKKWLSGRGCLTDTTTDRLQIYIGVTSYSSKCWGLAKYEIKFLTSLLHVASDKDNMYHYRSYPTGSDSWCKYNAARITAKLVSLGQVFQKTLFKAYNLWIK